MVSHAPKHFLRRLEVRQFIGGVFLVNVRVKKAIKMSWCRKNTNQGSNDYMGNVNLNPSQGLLCMTKFLVSPNI